MTLKYLGWSEAVQVKPEGLHYPTYEMSLAKPPVAGYEKAAHLPPEELKLEGSVLLRIAGCFNLEHPPPVSHRCERADPNASGEGGMHSVMPCGN